MHVVAVLYFFFVIVISSHPLLCFVYTIRMSSFVCCMIEGRRGKGKKWFGRSTYSSTTILDIFNEFSSGQWDGGDDIAVPSLQPIQVKAIVGSSKDKQEVSVNPTECVGDVVSCLGHFIRFVVSEPGERLQNTEPEDSQQKLNAFNLMMAAQRDRRNLPTEFVEVKKNNKIRLKNDILKWLGQNELGWAPDVCNEQGRYFIIVLAQSLWDLDGHQKSLEDRGCGIPTIFEEFSNYHQPEKAKHRKREHENLGYQKVTELSQSLFDLSSKSYFKQAAWSGVYNGILRLADNLRKYASYLEKHNVSSQTLHGRKYARTDVDHWEIYPALAFIKPRKRAKYKRLHEALQCAKPYEPVFINDFAPADRRRRNEFLNEIAFPCRSVCYTYTGLHAHLHFVWKFGVDDSETERQQRNDDTKKALKMKFPVFHTRAMRREFAENFGKSSGIKSGLLREAYRRLTGDLAAAEHLQQRELDERLRSALDDEDVDLLWDLRLTNGKQEEYHEFLERCQAFVQGTLETAVGDRRHDPVDDQGESVVHLAMAMSINDLHRQIVETCPEGTRIPSVQWLRLQFWPSRNSAAAHRNTGRLRVKMMVAARQFRKHCVDAHYASAVFRYEKEFCVRFRDSVTLVCEDDKHTVKVGEPGYPVSALERGKRVVVGLNQSFQVGDHDFTKFSLSPSVSLDVDVPEGIDGTFYHGQVHVGLKENAFEPSSCLRHAAELNHALNEDGKTCPVEAHYHDGGPDHNLRFTRTQLCQIGYFLQRDLDYLLLVQTPPNHSWKNPAERVMSNLNLALQGVGVMRVQAATFEKELKGASSLKDIRKLQEKFPRLKTEVHDAVLPVKDLLNSQFSRLHLKGKKFKCFPAASQEQLQEIADNLKKIDEDFDTTVLLDTSKPCKCSRKVKDFMQHHCRAGHYQFSIKKCADEDCICGQPRCSQEVFFDLHHIPYPEPKRDHYKCFEDLYGKPQDTERFVPSKLEKAAARHTMPFPPSAQKARNIKTVVQCDECLKWRVCYSVRVLPREQKDQLQRALEEISYSCGCCFQNIEDREGTVFEVVYVNDKLTCNSPMEVAYYSTFDEPLCFYCGSEHELTESPHHFPLCITCEGRGQVARNRRAFVARE